MDSKEDDDISIDFGKIKNFFKSKEESKIDASSQKVQEAVDAREIQGNGPKNEAKKEDEELSFDFSKIKRIFKSDEKQITEEMPVDWGKAVDFLKKYGIIFLALIPIVLAIYVRMQADFLPVTDEWAANTVYNGIRSQITSQISQQYPNLPDANKNVLVDKELQKIAAQNKKQIDETIKSYSVSFKAFFQDENGNRYTPDIDPYYWIRYAQNIINHGHPGDILRDGKPFDNHQLAPVGRFVAPNTFHSYILAYFHKFLGLFADISIMRSSFYLIPMVSALCVLLVFLISRKIAGDLGGFFAALMMAVNGAFLSRSLHPDDDVWVVFFPLLITWLFMTAIDIKKVNKILVAGVLAGFFNGLFAFSWNGWWYIFDFLMATIAVTFVYLILVNFSEIRKNPWFIVSNVSIRDTIIFGLVYFVSAALFISLFQGWSIFTNTLLGPLSFHSIKAPVTSPSLWPNVLTTVAELNEGSINGIINSVGGPFMFFIGLIGIVLSTSRKEGMKKFDFAYILMTALFYGIYFILRRWGSLRDSVFVLIAWIMLPIILRVVISMYKKDQSYDFKLSILLSLWVVSTIFASLKGIRFTVLLAPAFSVAFGVAFGKFYSYASLWLNKELKIHKIIGGSILIILMLLAYVNPIKAAIGSAGSDLPIINDAWYNALVAIKKDSKPNAIITSWWDFGHHFKLIADRPVTFDGTTQIFPAAHWVGKILMTGDEKQAIGILRMLNCGNINGFDSLFEIYNDPHKSLKILNEIMLMDMQQAAKRLKELNINENNANKILSYTHCEPPESYFIASEDMIGKSGVWSHFGGWNFERADAWRNARKLPQEKAVEYMMQKLNYSKERAENIYFEMQAISSDSEANAWISPWPGFAGTMSCRKNGQGIFECPPLGVGNNVALAFRVNLKNYDIYAQFQDKIFRPASAAFATETGVLKKRFNDTVTGHGMTVMPISKDEIQVVVSSDELSGSMFARMFYMNGHGLRYFKLFDRQRGLTGTNIYTYKLDWSGKNATIAQDYTDFFREPIEQKPEIIEANSTNTSNNSQ